MCLGVELSALKTPEAWTFFKQLDGEKRGEVTTEDFLMGCLRPGPGLGCVLEGAVEAMQV